MTTEARVSSGTPEKVTPHDIKAEKSLLCAMMIDNGYIDQVLSIVKRGDFYEKRHQFIFDAILALAGERGLVDIVTVADKLVKAGELDKIGGRIYLSDLLEETYTAANCERYAKIVQEKSTQRKIMHHSAKLFSKAQSMEGELNDLIEYAEKSLFDITTRNSSGVIRTQAEVAESYLRGLDEAVKAHDDPSIRQRWIQTGIPELDDKLFKLDAGLATTIAGESGHGKTVLAMKICDTQDQRGIHSAFITLEMPEEQLLGRYIQGRANLPAWRLRTGALDDEELALVYKEAARYSSGDCCIHLDNIKGQPSVFEFRRRVRWYKREFGIKLAVGDYFQKFVAPGYKWGNRNEELTMISNLLMEIASESSIHLILPAQKNRNDAARMDKRPVLSDLKDTGSLGHDVNNVIFIWLPWLIAGDRNWMTQHPKNIAHLVIVKQREGPTGAVPIYWNENLIRFESLRSHQEVLPV